MEWLIDYAEDFSGLSQAQIRNLVKKEILKPKKQNNAFYFSYTDIYILRIFRILRRCGLKHLSISSAFDYLKQVSPQQVLSSYALFHNSVDVFTIMDCTQYYVMASQGGQLILPETLQIISVGSELEAIRKSMQREEKRIASFAKATLEDSMSEEEFYAWLEAS